MIRKWFPLFLCWVVCQPVLSQTQADSIPREWVENTLGFLASNKLKGRVNFTAEQLIAAEFIHDSLQHYGLEPFPGFSTFYQPFRTGNRQGRGPLSVLLNGKPLDDSLYYFFPRSLVPEKRNLDEFFVLQVFPPVSDSLLFRYWNDDRKLLVWIILSDSTHFSGEAGKLVLPPGMPVADILIAGSAEEPVSGTLRPNKNHFGNVLYNVVGILPGTEFPEEAIIFSAHYDHVDFGPDGHGGEIFNGANDNASGTTAVMALARYFGMRKDNKRTLVFCLFAGEELGLLGSKAFINNIKPDAVKAVINIEMIGFNSGTGKNEFMLTGPYYSDLIDILKKNLAGEKFKVTGLGWDPEGMFERSDNYPFYLEGIPAHTIMCSDDEDPCYHRPCDDAKRIDFDNMTRVIRAIAKSSLSLVMGTDTPRRPKK